MKSALVEVPNETTDTGPVVLRQPEPVSLFRTDDPAEVVVRATSVATALRDVIEKQGLISNIQGKKYPKCEAWTLCGTMLGIFPVLCWSRQVENGWEARVEARTRSGEIVGAAEAQCLNTERNWSNRDDFAVRSMAQTRATAKALRMPLGFVMSLAGYQATPAEEMQGVPHNDADDGDLGPQKQSGAGTAKGKSTTAGSPPAEPPSTSTAARVGTFIPIATEARRDHVINQIIEAGEQEAAKGYLVEIGWILETETLADWPLDAVPVNENQFRTFAAGMSAYVDAQEGDTIPEPYPRNGQQYDNPKAKPVEVPRDKAVGDWRAAKVPFGKNQGTCLGDLSEKSLGWYCNKFKVQTSYKGSDGKTYNTKAENLARDKAFRAALDAAKAELGIADEAAQ